MPTGRPTDNPTHQPTDQPTSKPTSDTTEQPAVSGEIYSGNLDWGVKESFRSYIAGGARGKVELSGGAERQGDVYRFPDGSGNYDADAKFAGTVRFTGHEGKLDLRISDLKVRANGAKGILVADLSSKDIKTGKVSHSDDLTLADLTLPAGGLTGTGKVLCLDDVPATLTEGGPKAFAGFYEAGEALDPINLAVSLDKDASLPGGTTGSGGTSGSGIGGTGGTGSDTEAFGTGGVTGGDGGGGSTGGSGSLAATGADVPTGVLLGGLRRPPPGGGHPRPGLPRDA